MLAADTLGLLVCVWCSAWLVIPEATISEHFAAVAGATLVVTVLVARYQGFYHSIVRYVGMDLAGAGLKVTIASAATLATLAQVSGLISACFREAQNRH